MRLFCGWRLTTSINSLYYYNDTQGAKKEVKYHEKVIEDQSVCPLPGGMMPPTYSDSHTNYFIVKLFQMVPKQPYKNSLITWSKNAFKSSILIEHDHSETNMLYVKCINNPNIVKLVAKGTKKEIDHSIYVKKLCKTMHDYYIQNNIPMPNPDKKEYTMVPRYMHSLRYYNKKDPSITMYPIYTQLEKSIYIPQKIT